MPKICLMCGDSFPDATTFCPKDGSALRAAVHGDDLIGELIAERYLITDLISQGGMGAVYLASDVRLPQQFAVKVLRQQNTADQSLIARFRQEAEAVCRINHDRVARVFDFGFMPDDRAYIIMEYVAGRTLKQVIEERGALDPLEAAKITLMAAEGIDAAHRLGIVHRDLKPENIMLLDDPGGGVRVKVLDFGIAKLQNGDAEQTGHTQPGFVIGTPAWMSPEQLLGTPIDPRSDVYSLGLVSFALLTGERAFTGDSEQSEMLARISVPPRTFADVSPNIPWPRELQTLFDRTLSRDVNQRPNTAVVFASQLVDVASQWRESTGGRKNAAPAVAAATPSAVPSVSAPRSQTPVTVASTTPAKSSRTAALAALAVTVVGAIAVVVYLNGRGSNSTALPTASDTTALSGGAPAVPPSPAASADSSTSSTTTAALPANSAPPSASPTTTPTTTPPASPPANATADKPPAVKPTAPDKPADAPKSTSRNAELQRIMDTFDRDGSPSNSRETVSQIDALRSKLNAADQAWAQIYLGLAHYALGDKAQACSAFERAGNLPGASDLAKKDSEEKRLMIGCRP